MEKFSIRQMTLDDVEQVTEMEKQAFTSSAWDADIFIKEVEGNPYGHYFVLMDNDKMVGYIGLWIVEDHAQITTIAVDEAYRNRGCGAMLIKYAMTFSISKNVDMMSLEVRVTNESAKHLYEKFGFNYGGIRKNYYGPNEDALVMWVKLNE